MNNYFFFFNFENELLWNNINFIKVFLDLNSSKWYTNEKFLPYINHSGSSAVLLRRYSLNVYVRAKREEYYQRLTGGMGKQENP